MAKFALLLTGFVALALTLSTTAQAAPVDLYQGKVAAIADKSIMFTSRGGETLTFAVSPDCMVMLDGKQVSLSMLGVGNTVRISATLEGGVRLAKQIDAHSR